MDIFRTLLKVPKSNFEIQYSDHLLCMGSCFAEHIGEKLLSRKFNVSLNPFGILYNPISICDNLNSLLKAYSYSEEDIFEHQGRWNSFAHHGRFSAFSKSEMLATLEKETLQAQENLQRTNRILLTFGTAFVYIYKSTGQVVANCHKLSGKEFEKKRLSVSEIVAAWSQLIPGLMAHLPNLEIIFTVSPVRHIRDGMIENQRSKSALLLAIDQLEQKFDAVHYFPAYEALMDDLRDYRFYKDDMLHPSALAIDYIWDLFQSSFFTNQTQDVLQKLEKLRKSLEHQPLFPGTSSHYNFLSQQLEKLQTLKAAYPFLDFTTEIAALKSQLPD